MYVDDVSYLAAAHFQNHRIPADEACYTCHTDYALYGGVRAKFRGLRHIYVQYLGTPPRKPRKTSSSTALTTIESACTATWERARSKATKFIWPSSIRSRAMKSPASPADATTPCTT